MLSTLSLCCFAAFVGQLKKISEFITSTAMQVFFIDSKLISAQIKYFLPENNMKVKKRPVCKQKTTSAIKQNSRKETVILELLRYDPLNCVLVQYHIFRQIHFCVKYTQLF